MDPLRDSTLQEFSEWRSQLKPGSVGTAIAATLIAIAKLTSLSKT